MKTKELRKCLHLPPALFIYFRSARNLRSFLVRSIVSPLDGKVGSEKRNGK